WRFGYFVNRSGRCAGGRVTTRLREAASRANGNAGARPIRLRSTRTWSASRSRRPSGSGGRIALHRAAVDARSNLPPTRDPLCVTRASAYSGRIDIAHLDAGGLRRAGLDPDEERGLVHFQ